MATRGKERQLRVFADDTPVYVRPDARSAKIFSLVEDGTVDVLGEEGDFWRVRVYGSDQEGFVRKDALAPLDAPSTRRESSGALEESPSSRYAGASAVATALWALGWIIAFLGFIAAVVQASNYECSSEFFGSSCDDEGTARFVIFVGTLIASWLLAVIVLWAAYVLRLLSDIEGHLRERP